jgi:endonuclease/exonuclease/phosphatase family metal-dependent hydrolase
MRQLCSTAIRGVMTILASAALGATAAAQTTVTIKVSKTQVVYATLRGGTYANTNIPNLLETRAASDLSYARRAMLKFDTESLIPAGSTVTSAIMTVTVKGADAGLTRHIAAYQIASSWTETETTWKLRRVGQSWTTAGGDLGTKLATAVVSDTVGSKVSFDVTALVKAAVSGQLGSSRYSRVMLVDMAAPTNLSYRAYATPDDPTETARPTLTVTYGGSTSIPAMPTASSTSTLRVLEYNVHHGGIGTDGKYDPNRIVDWIVKMNADVASLCEMESYDSYNNSDGAALYKSLLEQKTGVAWYTWDIQDYGDWTAAGIRNVIVSKIPFSASYRHEFSIGKDRTVGGVTIAVNGRTINVASTHLDPDNQSYRTTEARELVPYYAGFAEDRILLGDFNDQPTTAPITTITAGYYDGWVEGKQAGVATAAPDNPNGYTRNSRIDYVFYSRTESHLTLQSIQVVDTRDANGFMPSDHREIARSAEPWAQRAHGSAWFITHPAFDPDRA